MSELEKDKVQEEKVQEEKEQEVKEVEVVDGGEKPSAEQPKDESAQDSEEEVKNDNEETAESVDDSESVKEDEVEEESEQQQIEELVDVANPDEAEDIEEAPDVENSEVEDRVNELLAQVEELKAEKEENEAFKEYSNFATKVADDLNIVASNVQQALQAAFKDNNIPTDVTLEDLKKLDPAKATLAEQFLRDADRVISGRKQLADQAVRNEFTKVVFKKAERLFKKYDISDVEAPLVAETFVNIMNTAGIADLHEDLAAKVELAVARGKFVTPRTKVDSVEAEEKSQQPKIEDSKEESVSEVDEQKEEAIPPEVEVQEEEQKQDTPTIELDEFTEGIAGEIGAAKHASGDLLAELAKIQDPRERVRFYKANEKEIIEASKHHYYNK